MTRRVEYLFSASFYRSLLCVILSFIFCISLLPTVGAVSKIPTPAEIKAQITKTYKDAKSTTGYKSFDGYCAHYVNTQLKLLGINKGYVKGNGNDQYDNYKNLSYSTGGYKIHTYSAKNYTLTEAIKAVASEAACVTNVLVGFEKTLTYAGRRYGHAHLIHAIMDGYVYFSESLDVKINGVNFSEGKPIVATFEEYKSKFETKYFEFEGIIWFEDEELTKLLQGGVQSPKPEEPEQTASPENTEQTTAPKEEETTAPPAPVVLDPGTYTVNSSSGLSLRSGATTDSTRLAVIPDGAKVYITETDGDWGRAYYDGMDGWVYLRYVVYKGELPNVYAEKKSSSSVTAKYYFSNVTDALSAYDGGEYVITLRGNSSITANASLRDGITLNVGKYTLNTSSAALTFDGGKLISAEKIPSMDAVPFIKASPIDGGYSYSAGLDVSVSADTTLNKGAVCLKFESAVQGISSISGAKVEFIVTNADGSTDTVTATVKNDIAAFTTDAISAKKLADALSVKVRVYAKSGSNIYECFSESVSCAAKDCLKKLYGKSDVFDRYIEGVLNYGSASQKYFAYNSKNLSNAVLSEAARKPVISSSDIVRAKKAPNVIVTSSAHVNSAQLVIEDSVSLRFGVSTKPKNTTLTLLVWTEEEYNALAENAKSAGASLSAYLVAENCKQSLTLSDGAFVLSDISPEKYADTYYFRLCQTEKSKTTYDYVVAYSVNEYCAAKLGDGVSEEIDELCLAIANYSVMASKYFGNSANNG